MLPRSVSIGWRPSRSATVELADVATAAMWPPNSSPTGGSTLTGMPASSALLTSSRMSWCPALRDGDEQGVGPHAGGHGHEAASGRRGR